MTTVVYFQNNSSLGFDISTRVEGEHLPRDRWKQHRRNVKPGERAKILSFNRSQGIADGRTHRFCTNVDLDGEAIRLVQEITGTAWHSRMRHGVEGAGLFDDRRTRVSSWQAGSRQIDITYRAYATGGDDDIEYVFKHRLVAPTTDDRSLNVLAYNVYLRPTTLFFDGQSTRAGLLPPEIDDYEVIVFSEAFDDAIRRQLIRGLRFHPFRTPVLGSDNGVDQDGGVFIASKHPLGRPRSIFYNVCSGSDCRAQKGAMYVPIEKPGGRRYHVFGTHAQAGDSRTVRAEQFIQLKSFIDAMQIPRSEPVIIAGDLNVDRVADPDELTDVLGILNASLPAEISGHEYTFDPAINSLTGSHEKRRFLDYVLFSNDHIEPEHSVHECRILRSEEEWRVFFLAPASWDLSDHYPVLGHFRFPRP